jgi:5-methylcytosine-specific restriction protein A
MRLATLKPRVTQTVGTRLKDSGSSASSKHLYGHRWRIERLEFLREHPMCLMCLADGVTELATIVDHVEPHKGSLKLFWDRRNWQPICKPHHDSHKARQEHADGYR